MCSQCGRPAVVAVGPEGRGTPLCVDCFLKFQQANAIVSEQNERLMNYLSDMAGAVVGLPTIGPRFPPRRPAVQIGGTTLNHFRIDNSAIGVLNTGSIGTIDAAVTALNHGHSAELAASLKDLSQAIISSSQVAPDEKNRALESLSLVASEATVPAKSRRRRAMLPLLADLASIFQGSVVLAKVWAKYAPVLEAAFQ